MAEYATPDDEVEQLTWDAAQLGTDFIQAVRDSDLDAIEKFIEVGSPAASAFKAFGDGFFRLVLRLVDPREAGQLAPYAMQIDQDGYTAMLEVGVTETDPESGHIHRLFGSGIVLNYRPAFEYHWLISEVLAVGLNNKLDSANPTDQLIMNVYRGYIGLPLRYDRLDPTEVYLLQHMHLTNGRYNIEEQINALQLWHDFELHPDRSEALMQEFLYGNPLAHYGVDIDLAWAAAVEYLISLFDYHEVDTDELVIRYDLPEEPINDCVREIATTLRVTEFDDRYSIHPDPVAHYRQVFGGLGIDPARDAKVSQAANANVFDSVEVPPDDDTFFGPQ